MTLSNKALCTTAIAFYAIAATAQNGINSPYSRYGFGMMSDRAMGFNKAMGGVGLGFRNGQEINPSNPASYSAVDSLTALVDLGFSIHNANLKMDNLQQNVKNSSFDYAAFQFRAARGVGVAFGILPLTNINYSFSSTSTEIDNDITYSQKFTGDGGLHQVFLGGGWRIFKPLSIGFNASYLYGTYNHGMTLSYSESSIYSLKRSYTADISTYMLDFGLQYDIKLNKKDKLTLGLTYSLGHNVNNDAYRYTQTINSSNSVEAEKIDTIKNAFQLPHSFGAGLTYYHGNKLRIGADFTLEKWGDVKFPSQNMGSIEGAYTAEKGQLNDRMKIAIGGDYIPNVNGRSYFSRMAYKIGGYYSTSYAKADITGAVNSKPYEYGVSAGVTLPISNRNIWHNVPKINVSVQWVHSNIPYLSALTNRKASLTENYFRFSLGITFSERWFYKWKVQ